MLINNKLQKLYTEKPGADIHCWNILSIGVVHGNMEKLLQIVLEAPVERIT